MNYRQKIGQYGEDLAVDYLIKKGFRITGRNVKVGCKEIDIVAEISSKIVIFEVKTRITELPGSAEENFSRRKINNLIFAAESYAVANRLNPDDTRLDFISIEINKRKKIAKIKHFKDVF